MSDINVQLVRDFFELNAFHAMTFWQHDHARTRTTEHGLQLFVENTAAPVPVRSLECVLRPGDVSSIDRAIVEVRAWHADRFYASVIESNTVLFDVARDEARIRARQVFGGAPYKTILIISEFSPSPEPRQRAISLLQQGGIDHVIEFPTLLHDILDKISAFVSYSPSPTLQTLRLLKRYDFIRRLQLELPFPTEAVASPTLFPLDTVVPPATHGGEDEFDEH